MPNLFADLIITDLRFVLMIVFTSMLVGYRMPRRNHFVFRAIAGFASLVAVSLLWRLIPVSDSFPTVWTQIFKYLTLYITLVLAISLAFKCDFWAALFCGTVGYSMQHIGSRVSSVSELLFYPEADRVIEMMASTLIHIAVYAIMWFLFIRSRRYDYVNLSVDNKMQIVVAASVVNVNIIINALAIGVSYKYGATDFLLYIYVFSFFCAFLGFFVELNLLSRKRTEEELIFVKHLLNEEREQYINEKENIELINIKCHDLKHQINTLKGNVDRQELEEITNAVEIYDSVISTGNEALDVVLKKKSLYCYKNKIKISCLIDGNLLSFFDDHEVYSLFGNAVENAIESVMKLSPEKRIISMTQRTNDNFFIVRVENYFDGSLTYRNGLPRTKKDDNYHGFGLKSIKLLVERYGGRLRISTTADTFVLEMLFAKNS